MRAAVLERPAPAGDGPLAVTTLPDPVPAPGELLLRLDACAVCRTDLQICEGDIEAHRIPVVPGHQAVGSVEALGEGVEGWGVGDRAGVAWLAGACGDCARCAAGRENLCESARFTGWDRDGGYAEFVTVRAAFAHPLPATLDPVEAAPLLCGGVIGYRALRLSGIEPGGRLGLYGFGASARLALQVATHWGCEVFVATRSARDRQRARELGAAWSGGTDDPPPPPSTQLSPSPPPARLSSPPSRPSTGEARSPSTPSISTASPSSPTSTSGGNAASAASPTSPAGTRASSLPSPLRSPSAPRPRSTPSTTPTKPSPTSPPAGSMARRSSASVEGAGSASLTSAAGGAPHVFRFRTTNIT